MTSPLQHPMDALEGLLDERRRYEAWLAQLDGRREQNPPNVFERVRTDYAGRLDKVMDQLRSRGSDLQASAQAMDEQVSVLLADENAHRDARAEVELRALVGEYSTERANQELAVCDAEIARLASERSAVTAELQRVQEILALVRQPVAAPASPPPPGRPLAPPPGGDAAAAFDELAFLQSVVEPPSSQPFPTSGTRPPERAQINGPDPLGGSGSPAVREPRSVRPSAPTPNATPSFLKDMPTEQVKTLRCQECGTMNYPTEWYCERCGGELAAM